MNCQQCQRHLLSCERFDSQPPEVAGHLADCQECRQWQRRLLLIESHVPALPLPLSQGKEQFLQDFVEGKTILPLEPPRWSYRRMGMMTAAAVAFVLAACLMVINALSRPERQPVITKRTGPQITDKALAGRLLELNLRLAEAESPRRRV